MIYGELDLSQIGIDFYKYEIIPLAKNKNNTIDFMLDEFDASGYVYIIFTIKNSIDGTPIINITDLPLQLEQLITITAEQTLLIKNGAYYSFALSDASNNTKVIDMGRVIFNV